MPATPTPQALTRSKSSRPRPGKVSYHPWVPQAAPLVNYVAPPGFSQALITEVFPPKIRGSQVYLKWTSSAVTGSFFQVYIDQALAWFGQRRCVRLPIPSGLRRIDIGTVGAGGEQTSWNSSLPAAPARRATLSWTGGTYLDPNLAGYAVYGSDVPNGPIDYTTPLAKITAYPAGIITDGYGMGSYGSGGYGSGSQSWSWTSDPLPSGTWSFAVQPYNAAGNYGSPQLTSVVIQVPPDPPAPYANATRLAYSYAGGTRQATITWLASPG
jgi:hypothetical protein